MKGNFRKSPLKTRVLILTKTQKLTLGRIKSSYKLLFNSYFKHSNKKLYINNLEITSKILNKKLYFQLKNAYNKSIN